MTALQIANQLIQSVIDNEGKDIECLIEVMEYDSITKDVPVGELSIEQREGLNHPATIKFIQ